MPARGQEAEMRMPDHVEGSQAREVENGAARAEQNAAEQGGSPLP